MLIAAAILLAAMTSHPALAAPANENSTNIDLYAQAAVLMDARTGRVLFDKNADARLPMASTTKIMTCILALENGNPDDYVKVSGYAAGMPKVKLYMKEGEYYRLGDLLYSLMLESHNDTAVAIAEHIAGSCENFAAMMNQKARDIGCFDTNYITPNGLDAATADGTSVHSTTARDLAAVMSYCINTSPMKADFLKITGTPSYQFTNYRQDAAGYQSAGRSFSVNNHNAFLSMMEGALSGKTGFTGKAGYCYVGALESDERLYVVALLACGWPNNKNYKWSDTRKLMTYGLENYTYRNAFAFPDLETTQITVTDGIPASKKPYGTAETGVQTDTGGDNPAELRWLLGPEENIDMQLKLADHLPAPVTAGESVGTVSFYLNGDLLKEYPVTAVNTVPKISFNWVASYILHLFCL